MSNMRNEPKEQNDEYLPLMLFSTSKDQRPATPTFDVEVIRVESTKFVNGRRVKAVWLVPKPGYETNPTTFRLLTTWSSWFREKVNKIIILPSRAALYWLHHNERE